jgi:hypothetical protein
MSQESTERKTFGLSSLWLKIIGTVLMTLDHVALLFIDASGGVIPTAYYVLRAIGKISFPIFAFLAVEGVYHTHNIRNYLLRLLAISLIMDLFGYLVSLATNITIATNPLIGNVFTDLFLGVLTVYLLRKKNKYSLFALLPIAYAVLSNYVIDVNYGTLFKTDWGTFSIVLFVVFFLCKEISNYYLKRKALTSGLDEDTYLISEGLRDQKIIEAVGLIFVELLFYLIYRLDYTSTFIPNEFVPIGTYSALAFIFILLYNGKKGYENKIVQYSFYAYYPLHLIILGLLSLSFGVLSLYL